MKDRILAIVPARSGSKGIKDKNIKELNGKPLIAYSIEAAINSQVFEDIIVSTDSEKYKKVSEKYGAWVPFLRPKELAEDRTDTNDVIVNVLFNLEQMGKRYDSIMVLQPTSPLRDSDDIKCSIKLFYEKEANSVVSMCECDHSPLLVKELDGNLSLDGFLSNLKEKRRQDLKKFYRLNGAIYLSKVEHFLKYKDFYKDDSYAYIMDKRKSVDIDDLYDFKFAEMLIKEDSDWNVRE